jgi:hypothetical protein
MLIDEFSCGPLFSTWRRLSGEQKLVLLLLATVPSLVALLLIRLTSPSECVVVSTAATTSFADPPRATPARSPLTIFDELEAEVAELKLQLAHLSDARVRDVAHCEARSANATARVHELQSLLLTQRDKWRQETQETIAQLERSLASATAANRPVVPGAVIDAMWTDRDSAQWRAVIRRSATRESALGDRTEAPAALRSLLRNRWIFFYGDSTMRVLFNALLDAIDAPPNARLLYGDACVDQMNATDSRDMCRCRLEQAHKDWIDSSSGLRVSLAWKESMSDGEHDRRRFERDEWIAGQHKARRPDVLVVNSGFHAYHLQSRDEAIVFRGENLTANVPLRVAAEADELLEWLSLYISRGGCVIWRATNSVSSVSQRLAAAPFVALSRFVTPLLLKRGVHVFNATESLSLSPPASHASQDGLHYEPIAPIWASLLARSVEQLCVVS